MVIVFLLGQNIDQPIPRPNRSGPPPFSVGDKVQVTVTVDQLKCMQQGHGGWNPRMAEVFVSFFPPKMLLISLSFSILEKSVEFIE